MKRKIVSLFLVLMLISSLAFSVCALEVSLTEDGNSVYDEAGLLTSSEEKKVAEALDDISREYDAQIVIVTIPELGSDPDEFVEDLYDTMDFGYGDSYDGVLLMVCMDPREYRILSNGFAANAIDPNTIDDIGDAIVSDLSSGDYADAFLAFADECEYYLDGYINGFAVDDTLPDHFRKNTDFSIGSALLSSLVVGVVVGLVVVAILAAQLKSVRKKNQAKDYVRPGSMHLTQRDDTFLYRNVSRTRRESSSSGSRSRSSSSSHSRSGGSRSRSVGGGKF